MTAAIAVPTDSTVDIESLYLEGSQVPTADVVAISRNAAGEMDFWRSDARWFKPPEYPVQNREPRLQWLTQEIARWTGWSDRDFAKAVDTSHPTISELRGGRTNLGRLPDVAARIKHLHTLCERLGPLVGSDPDRLGDLLRTEIAGRTALDHLRDGDLPKAYLAALEAFEPRRTSAMMQSLAPARHIDATEALYE